VSRTSPSDLAVAFRSLDRRRREALGGADDAAPELQSSLQSVIAEAAAEVGVPAGADLAATSGAVAAAIERKPADAWDVAQLDRLRTLALRAGGLIREIATAVERSS
jgi:hypothetical protein